MSIGDRLRDARLRAGHGENGGAASAGIDVNRLRKLEGGAPWPTADELVRLGRAFNITPMALVFPEAEASPELVVALDAFSQLTVDQRTRFRFLVDVVDHIEALEDAAPGAA